MENYPSHVDEESANILASSIIWDNHTCLPLRPDDAFLPELERCRQMGQTVVTINVGFDLTSCAENVRVLAHFRHWVRRHADRFLLIRTVADVYHAKSNGLLGVCFDLEGTCALSDQLSMVEFFYDLGVRWMLIAYNRNNSAGGGCQDDDTGLTPFGRSVLDEMLRVGMVPCCSHTGWRTALEVMDHVAGPVIFSHSNAHAVYPHPRNIPDQLIKACAATGGVIGVNGIGAFLGENVNTTEALFRHLDHMVHLVGPNHVGLGLDFVYDKQELDAWFSSRPDLYPSNQGYAAGMKLVEPERIMSLVRMMRDHHYPTDAIKNILGGNHLRVAKVAWR